MRKFPYIYYLTILFLLCLPIVETVAQNKDLNTYLENVQGNSLLYRGRIEKHYSFKYKGTYFVYQEEYVAGDVYYNKKLYTGVLLNLNAETDELSVRLTSSHLPVSLDKSLVEHFTLGEKRFVNVRGGYYEILVEGDVPLMKKTTKEYRENLVSSGQDSKIEKVYDSVLEYYLVKGEEWIRVTGKGTFTKLFRENKKDINEVFRSAPRIVRDDKDMLYKRVMEVVR